MKPITLRINFLFDNHCQECKKTKGLTSSGIAEYCKEKCDVGKELYALGCHLDAHEPRRAPKNTKHGLTKEAYLEEKKNGISDYKIAVKYGIAQSGISRRRKLWGIAQEDVLARIPCNQCGEVFASNRMNQHLEVCGKPKKKCTLCDRTHHAKGYCESHYKKHIKESRECETTSN